MKAERARKSRFETKPSAERSVSEDAHLGLRTEPMKRASNLHKDPRPETPRAQDSALAQALKLEGTFRQARSFHELSYIIANELPALTRAQQIFVMRMTGRRRVQVSAVSSMPIVDRASALISELEAHICALVAHTGGAEPHIFEASSISDQQSSPWRSYPLTHMYWVPFVAIDGQLLGGMVQARSTAWTAHDQAICAHLAGAAAFAWQVVAPHRSRRLWQTITSRRGLAAACLLAGLAACMPVSMSALAPAEVVPRDPFIVTAGVDGVIADVKVEPNTPVKAGDLLVNITDTVLRNRHIVAERQLAVAEAASKRAQQMAFSDMRGRHELVLTDAEIELKRAERDYAAEMLSRANITAGRDGVVVFADRKELIGRPVAAGEKLMEIVDPTQLDIEIALPVSDAIVLKAGARVTLFLDSDPLRPIGAKLVRTDYEARVRENQQASFRLVARAEGERAGQLRLGVRGTAQVYGEKTLLAFYLLRRPLSSLRQMIGI